MHLLRPRSASENNVLPPSDSDSRPSIRVFRSLADTKNKQNERPSSSATTSSSDRSPVVGHSQVNRMFLEEPEEKMMPDTHNVSNSDNEEFTTVISSTELSDDYRQTSGSTSCNISRACFDLNNQTNDGIVSATVPQAKKYDHQSSLQSRRSPVHHLRIPDLRRRYIDGGSDGGEESGMGDMELPTTDTDSWNVNRSAAQHRCPCLKAQVRYYYFLCYYAILMHHSITDIATVPESLLSKVGIM